MDQLRALQDELNHLVLRAGDIKFAQRDLATELTRIEATVDHLRQRIAYLQQEKSHAASAPSPVHSPPNGATAAPASPGAFGDPSAWGASS